MVKIEKVDAGVKAMFLRDGVNTPVFTGMLISVSEMEAMQITGGTITVSIDEAEIKVLGATAAAPVGVTLAATVESEVKAEDAPATLELKIEETAKAKPAKVIVQPTRKK
jgi:hypothetical protein